MPTAHSSGDAGDAAVGLVTRGPSVKYLAPPARPGWLPRAGLVARLTGGPEPVIVLTAPPGYGKSTIMGHVAVALPRTTYVRLDETDTDPTQLLHTLVTAVGRIADLDEGLAREVAFPAEVSGFQAPARFARALEAIPAPSWLLIDDVHVLEAPAAVDWLGWILERLPPTLRVVLAGRRDPGLPTVRLAAAGQLVELTVADLRLTADEVEALAALDGVVLTPAQAQALAERTEGWPLAVDLALRTGVAAALADGDGTEQLRASTGIGRYLRAELLSRLHEGDRAWVLRSSVLDELDGPGCDEILGEPGSLARLRHMEAANQLVLPVDERRTAFRYHQLYRDLLRDELEAVLPGEAARVAAAAAAWHEAQGRRVDAVRFARRSGDPDLFAASVERHAFPVLWAGGLASVREWTAWFDRDGLRERHGSVAYMAAWVALLTGDPVAASHWLAATQRTTDTRPSLGVPDHRLWAAIVRSVMMPDGLAVFDRDVALMDAIGATDGQVGAQVRVILVLREMVHGRFAEAGDLARRAEDAHRARGAAPGLLLLATFRALSALAAGDLRAAARPLEQALELVHDSPVGEYAVSGLLYGTAAHVAVRRGATSAAREHLAHVNRIRPVSNVAMPWLAVAMRVQAIRAALGLRDAGMARTLLAECEDVLRLRSDLGPIVREVRALRPEVAALRDRASGAWTLTAAELRLLQYLPTHLTFREIADRMGLSPHTIKTQGMSIYGKLDAASRREAIEAAVEAGLLDASVLHHAGGSTPVA